MGSLDQIARSRQREKHLAELTGGSHRAGGGTLDQIARQRKSGGPEIPVVGAPKSAAKKHHGGLLDTLKHVVTQVPKDLADAAYHTPGGLYAMGHAVESDLLTGAKHGDLNPITALLRGKNTRAIAKGQVELVKQDVTHPLRHPGNTLLDALALASLGAGTAARVGEVGRVARAGEGAGAIGKAALEGPKPPPRVLNVGGLEVRGHYSRAAGSRTVQRLADKALAKGAGKSRRVEDALHRRAAKWESRNQRTADAVARAPGTTVSALGARLKPHELRALRLVAEETPVERRLGAQEMRKGRATNVKEQARHQERIDLTRAAMEHLTADSEGRPIFKPEATKLRAVYKAIEKASADREGILKNLDLMDEASLQAAKTKVARVAAGARSVRPRTVEEAQARLAKLERRENTALDNIAGRLFGHVDRGEVNFRTRENARAAKQASGVDSLGRASGASGVKAIARKPVTQEMRKQAALHVERLIETAPDHPVARAWAKRTEEIAQLRDALNPELFQKVDPGRLGEVKSKTIVGAEDIVASPAAVHIGNPVERTKLRGKPKVSSTGTFGHTQKPSSLRTATGGSVEHALERNDVTQIVAERHAEAVRLSKIDRVVQRYKSAGEHTPRRKDDVWMWTDKTVSSERIPKEVRDYLDNPDAIAKLTPDAKGSLYDKVRDATFEKHDWQDPEKVAEFERLAKAGKGVFVPRKLLGEYAKRSFHVGDNAAIKVVDAINNAQKAALVYAKVNYPLVQAVSNTAMNLIHQGPFAVRNLHAAVTLDSKVGPELAAITDDIMGQGAVIQAAFEGQGAIATATQRLAHVMSSKVDTPARRSAFYHEAIKAGYRTPEKYRALLTDEAHVGDLGEVAQRAREAIVDYGDMGPVERNIIRRVVFVYPWQKGATKYAGHFLRDHPVQAAALAQLGALGKKESDLTLGSVPSYLAGLIPTGGGRTVNPSGVNFFQTPAQIGEGVVGLVTGNPAQASAGLGFLAPTPALVAALLSGRDDIGRPLKGNLLTKTRDLTIGQTPLSALALAASGGAVLTRCSAAAARRRRSRTPTTPSGASCSAASTRATTAGRR